MNGEEEFYEQYKDLANAIILQAVSDYQKALKILKTKPKDTWSRRTKIDVESFFNSGWFCALSNDMSAKEILEHITKEQKPIKPYNNITKSKGR